MKTASLSTFIIAAMLCATTQAANFPSADEWVNSKPLDLNALKGKLVVLTFYEET